MELDFTDDQEELRASVRAVLDRECPPSLVRAMYEGGDGASGASAGALWRQMVGLDWPALTVGEADGGLGLGFVELTVVVEELGRVVAPGPLLPTTSQFVPVVREAGDEAQRARFLGGVARGEVTGTLALAEASGSWDPADVDTVASPEGAGDGVGGWRLTGTKHYVVEGDTVDELVVVARTPGSRGDDGIGLFVVPRSDVTVGAMRAFDASRHHAVVELEGVTVGADRVLGTPGPGVAAALVRALEESTVALAVEMVGTCQAILDRTVAYAKEREQFGVPIGSFQAVKHKLADMLVAVERARACCYFAAACIAEDDPRRPVAAAMAKAAAGDAQRLVTQDGIQLHGGIGYTWEHDLHLWVKRAKSGDATFGTAADHRARLADLVGL